MLILQWPLGLWYRNSKHHVKISQCLKTLCSFACIHVLDQFSTLLRPVLVANKLTSRDSLTLWKSFGFSQWGTQQEYSGPAKGQPSNLLPVLSASAPSAPQSSHGPEMAAFFCHILADSPTFTAPDPSGLGQQWLSPLHSLLTPLNLPKTSGEFPLLTSSVKPFGVCHLFLLGPCLV